MGSVCIDTLVWKSITAGTTGQGAWQPLPTWDICAHAEPVPSARHSCVSRAVAAPGSASGASHDNLQLEDAPNPNCDTLWQIRVLKMKLKILNRWVLGLQFSREHQLTKTVEWDKVAQSPGLAGSRQSRWHFFCYGTDKK